jgi:hypothetical protein
VAVPSQAFANNPGFAATQASPGLGAALVQPPPTGPGAASSAAVPSFEQLAPSRAGQDPLPVLGVPSVMGLIECLETLVSDAPALDPVGEVAFESLDRPHLCRLLDDEGRERGAIIFDLTAAMLLGAALLALPREEALRQVNDNEPSEDALLAMSEICNSLTGPINGVPGNEHVRSTAMSSADVSALPRPRARLDLSVDGGALVLAMF